MRKFTITNAQGEPYLTRYKLFVTRWFGIYLHEIHRSDEDRALHDHPWDFTSIILWGGYFEETPSGIKDHGVFSIIRHKAEDAHKLTLKKKTWTLVFRGRNRRHWGFYAETGWVHHLDYLKEKFAGTDFVTEDDLFKG